MGNTNKKPTANALPMQLNPAERYSLEANKTFETLAEAKAYLKKDNAYAGNVIAVYNDTDANNGVYWVKHYADTEYYPDGELIKVGSSTQGNVFVYKGTVASIELLPSTGMEPGHVYNVGSGLDGMNYVWNGEAWDSLGLVFDTNGLVKQEWVINHITEQKFVNETTLGDYVKTEVLNTALSSKQDLLAKGTTDGQILIWSTEDGGNWTVGNQKTINDFVPEGTENNSVLIYNEGNVSWSPFEVQPELPDYASEDAGKVLTTTKTETGKTKLIWSSVGNSTTITEDTKEDDTVISYNISNGTTTANVYSVDGVNKLLSWEEL